MKLIDALKHLYARGYQTVTANQVANELYPDARQHNTQGQTFNLAAGVTGRLMTRCKAVARREHNSWDIVPEYFNEDV